MIFKFLFYGLLIIFLIFLWSRRKYYMLSFKLPGPIGFPLIGNGLNFIHQEKIKDFLLGSRHKHGPVYVGYLGLTPVLVVSDPVAAEKFLTSTVCINKSFIYHAIKVGLGDGLFTSDYLRWSHHRKLLNPTFNHKILLSFYPILNKEAKTLVNILSKYIGKGPIHITPLLQKCTLATACQTTMGKEMNIQYGKNGNIVEAYSNMIKYGTERIFTPWYMSDFLYQFFPVKKDFDKVVSITRKFVANLIQEKTDRTNQVRDNDISSNKSDDDFSITKSKNIFLDQAYKLMETKHFTAEDVRCESNTIVVAAFETTATVLYTTLMCLAMFPKYQDKVFEEILSIIPEKDIEITYEDTQQMVYLEMVINESMRVISPVPLIARDCTEDFYLYKGITIPKGTQIAIDIFSMQRCEKLWGPKAKTFDPDHFLKDNFSQMHPYSFIPFAKGLRNCIGWRYAMMSLKVFLAQTLRSYRFTTDFKFEDLKFVLDITTKFVDTPLLELHERNI